jgi:hypothetical protein
MRGAIPPTPLTGILRVVPTVVASYFVSQTRDERGGGSDQKGTSRKKGRDGFFTSKKGKMCSTLIDHLLVVLHTVTRQLWVKLAQAGLTK